MTRFRPGQGQRPDPLADRVTWDGDASSLGEQELFRWGIDLYNRGYFWEAHEAWEQLWRRAVGDACKHFLQGLILAAGAALKAAMDRSAGCRRLARKALHHLADAPDSMAGVSVREFAHRLRAFAATSARLPVPVLRLSCVTA